MGPLRKKVERAIKKTEKLIDTAEDDQEKNELEEKLRELKIDYNYVMVYLNPLGFFSSGIIMAYPSRLEIHLANQCIEFQHSFVVSTTNRSFGTVIEFRQQAAVSA
ncbi:8783_t:CDS:2, partial [Entrophospora sp. SA101]